MDDVFPRRNLPAEAEQWGRVAENRIVGVESSLEILSQFVSGQNRSTASTLGLLGAQVRDLAGRVSYTWSDPGSQSWTSTQPDNQPAWGSDLVFTVEEPRWVSITYLLGGRVYVSHLGGAASGFVNITPTVFLNGNVAGEVQPGLEVTLPPGTAARSNEVAAPLTARALVLVEPGTHSVRGGFRWRRVTTSSGSGVLGIITAESPQLFVDVLQIPG